MIAGRWSSRSIQIPQFLMLWWPTMKAGSTAMRQRPRDRVPGGSMLALPDPRRPDKANPPTNFWWSLFLTALAWSTCTVFPLDRQGILCWGFKGVQKEIPSVSGISTRTMHQSTTPCLSQTIWPKWTVPHPPYSPDPAPWDSWLFPKLKEKLRGCRYETIEEMKEAVTKLIDTLTQEDFHGAF